MMLTVQNDRQDIDLKCIYILVYFLYLGVNVPLYLYLCPFIHLHLSLSAIFATLYTCIYLSLRHLCYIIHLHLSISQASTFIFIFAPLYICIYLSGICSTDEIEWNRNGDGVIDFYPLHFLFPASKICICVFVFVFVYFYLCICVIVMG